MGLLDSTGALVVEYRYDAWGKPIATTGNLKDTLGKKNPFRYRGYVYDEETGLYYLRSRYYNPTVGRFVNADNTCDQVGALFGHSLYTYCINAPVNRSDASGTWSKWISKAINCVAEYVTRTIINTVSGRLHASGSGKFSITSVSKNTTITTSQASKHNSAVSDFVDTVAFALGTALGSSVINTPKWVSKIISSTAGGFFTGKATGAIQDIFVDAFTVRAGTYTSVQCQYERNFKVFYFFEGIEVHNYELRIYPDYCEVWYSYLYSGYGSTITAPQKIGEMTAIELDEAMGGL